MSYCQTAGFIYGVACAPELVKPQEWLTVVLNTDNPADDETGNLDEILEGLMTLYNEINRQVQDQDAALLPGCKFHKEPLDNFEEDAPIHQWSTGFAISYSWLSEMWSSYIAPGEMTETATNLQMVLSFFTDRDFTSRTLDELETDDLTLERFASDMQKLFPDALEDFALLAYNIQQVIMERENKTEQPAISTKIGRNEPCHCGSGKKYKKCCGPTIH